MRSLERVIGPVTPSERGVEPVEADLKVGESFAHSEFPCDITDFEYSADPGHRVPGTIIRPISVDPEDDELIVLYFHQTTDDPSVGRREPCGLGGSPELAYGIEIASRGYTAMGTDYPGFGEYAPDTYQLGYESITAQMVWNHLVLLKLGESIGVNPTSKVLSIGHSLGGTNAMIFSAYCHRVAAMICSGSATTFCAFANSHDGDLSRWARKDKYMPLIASEFGNDPRQVPFDIPDVLSEFCPKTLVLSATEGDEIFPRSGSVACSEIVREKYRKSDAVDRFMFILREGPHQFDSTAREMAYDFALSK